MTEEQEEPVEGLEPLDDEGEDGVSARFDTGEWEMVCGACGGFLVDCVWVDITATMALNAPDREASIAIRRRMASHTVRSFRMEVALAFGEWQADGRGKVWRRESPLRHRSRIPRRSRVLDDQWNGATLGRSLAPPFLITCPACQVVQRVGRYRRRGLPPLEQRAA